MGRRHTVSTVARPGTLRYTAVVLAALLLTVGMAAAAAGPVDAGFEGASLESGPYETVEPAVSLSRVEDFLAAFQANYRPGDYEQHGVNVAAAALIAAQNMLAPSVTFAEELSWNDFTELSIELAAGVELPLVSSTAAAELDLATFDLTANRLAQRHALQAAHAAHLVDLIHLSAVTWARRLVDDVLRQTEALGLTWLSERAVIPSAAGNGAAGSEVAYSGRADSRATGSGVAARPLHAYVAPEERMAFAAYQRVAAADEWLREQYRALSRRLSDSVGRPPSALHAPGVDELASYLALKATPSPTPKQCQATSPLVEEARLRREQNLAQDALKALPEFSLALSANVDYTLGPWSTTATQVARLGAALQNGASGAVALEGRLLLPDRWPLGGNVGIEVTPSGASQRVSLAWPPPPAPSQVPVDRDRELDRELAAVAADLRESSRAHQQAVRERAQLEQRLRWALLDATPTLSAAEVDVLLAVAAAEPTLRLPALTDTAATASTAFEFAELRVEHVFARAAELTALVHYLASCGRL